MLDRLSQISYAIIMQHPEGSEVQQHPNIKSIVAETISKLSQKNNEIGGGLFKIVGKTDVEGSGRPEANSLVMIFDNPLRKEVSTAEGTKTVQHFLTITPDGFRVIEVDDGALGRRSNTPIKDVILSSLADGQGLGWDSEQGKMQFGDFEVSAGGGEVEGFPTNEVRLVEEVSGEEAQEIIEPKLKGIIRERQEAAERKAREERIVRSQIDTARVVSDLLDNTTM